MASDKADPSLDVAALGGVEADRISLESTDKGVGVNVEGAMSAGAGNISLSAEGKIVIGRVDGSSGRVSARRGDVILRSKSASSGGISLSSDSKIEAEGNVFLAATDKIELATNSLVQASETVRLSSQGDILMDDGFISGKLVFLHTGEQIRDGTERIGTMKSTGEIRATHWLELKTIGDLQNSALLSSGVGYTDLKVGGRFTNQEANVKSISGIRVSSNEFINDNSRLFGGLSLIVDARNDLSSLGASSALTSLRLLRLRTKLGSIAIRDTFIGAGAGDGLYLQSGLDLSLRDTDLSVNDRAVFSAENNINIRDGSVRSRRIHLQATHGTVTNTGGHLEAGITDIASIVTGVNYARDRLGRLTPLLKEGHVLGISAIPHTNTTIRALPSSASSEHYNVGFTNNRDGLLSIIAGGDIINQSGGNLRGSILHFDIGGGTGSLYNFGVESVISAMGNLSIEANELVNEGELSSYSSLGIYAVNLSNSGRLSSGSSRALSIVVKESLENYREMDGKIDGGIISGGVVQLSANDLINTGSHNSVAIIESLDRASRLDIPSLMLRVKDGFSNRSMGKQGAARVSGESLLLGVGSLLNDGGLIGGKGSTSVSVVAIGDIENRGEGVLSATQNVSLVSNVGNISNVSGSEIFGGSSLILKASQGSVLNALSFVRSLSVGRVRVKSAYSSSAKVPNDGNGFEGIRNLGGKISGGLVSLAGGEVHNSNASNGVSGIIESLDHGDDGVISLSINSGLGGIRNAARIGGSATHDILLYSAGNISSVGGVFSTLATMDTTDSIRFIAQGSIALSNASKVSSRSLSLSAVSGDISVSGGSLLSASDSLQVSTETGGSLRHGDASQMRSYGSLRIMTLGAVINRGDIVSGGTLFFSGASLDSRGSISSGGASQFDFDGTVINRGDIVSGGTLSFSGDSLDNPGNISSGGASQFAFDRAINSGDISSSATLSFSGASLDNLGSISSGGASRFAFDGEAVINDGSIVSGGTLSFSGASLDNLGNISSGGASQFAFDGTVINRGNISSGATLPFSGASLDNLGSISSGGASQFAFARAVINRGNISSSGATLSFSGASLDNLGSISSGGASRFAFDRAINRGDISSSVTLSFSGASLDNPGNISSGGASRFAFDRAINRGDIVSGGTLSFSGASLDNLGNIRSGGASQFAFDGGTVINRGDISSSVTLSFSGASLDNLGNIRSGGASQFAFDGGTVINRGDISSSVTLSFSGASLDNLGSIRSSGASRFAFDGGAVINDGSIVSGGTLLFSGASLDNPGNISSGGAPRFAFDGTVINRGDISSSVTLSFSGASLDNLGNISSIGASQFAFDGTVINRGDISSSATLSFSGDSLDNLGSIRSSGASQFDFDGAINSGDIVSGGTLSFSGASLDNLGNISSGGASHFAFDGTVINDGSIVSGGTLSFSGTSLDNLGNIRSSGASQFAFDGTVINDGSIVSSVTLSFSGDSLDNSGNISSGGASRFAFDRAINSGDISSSATLSFSGASLDNSGSIRSIGASQFAFDGTVINRGNISSSGDTLLFSGASLDNLGNISSIGASQFAFDRAINRGDIVSSVTLSFSGASLDNPGNISSGGASQFDFDGTVINRGDISSSGGTLLFSGASLDNLGSIRSTGASQFAFDGTVINRGDIVSSVTLSFSGASLDNLGNISSGGASRFAFDRAINSGDISSSGGTLLFSGASLDNSGNISSIGASRFAFDRAINSGDISSSGDTLSFSGDSLDNLGSIRSIGASQFAFDGTVINRGNISSSVTLSFSGASLDNLGNISSGGASHFAFDRAINRGDISSSGDTLSFSGASLDNPGNISSSGASQFAFDGTVINRGNISSSGDTLSFSGASLDNLGNISSGGASHFAFDRAINRGDISSSGDTLSFSGASLDNLGNISSGGASHFAFDRVVINRGELSSSDTLSFSGTSLDNLGSISSSGASQFAFDGTVINRGELSSGDTLSFSGASLDNSGNIRSSGASQFAFDGTVINRGELSSGDTLSFSGTSLDNLGSIRSSGASQFAFDGAVVNRGELSSGDTLSFSGTSLDNLGSIRSSGASQFAFDRAINRGDISSSVTLSFSGASLDNLGNISSGGASHFDFDGGTVINRGNISSSGVTLSFSGASLDNSGSISSGGASQFDFDGTVINRGDISSSVTLSFSGASLDNLGSIRSIGASQFAFDGAVVNRGELSSSDTLSFSGASLDNLGSIRSTGASQFAFDGTVINRGDISSSDTLSFSGASLDNLGSIRSTGASQFAFDGTVINRGELSSSGNLLFSGASLDNLGNISSGGASQFAFDGTVINRGDISSSVTLSFSGASLDNLGNISSIGASQFAFDGTVINRGELSSSDTLSFSGASLDNLGNISSGGASHFAFDGTVINRGDISSSVTLSFSGASLDNLGNISSTGASQFAFDGTIINRGDISSGATLSFSGASLDNLGNIRSSGASQFAFDGGTVINRGDISSSATLSFSGASLDNLGSIRSSGASQFDFDGTIINRGTMDALKIFLTSRSGDIRNRGRVGIDGSSILAVKSNGVFDNRGGILLGSVISIISGQEFHIGELSGATVSLSATKVLRGDENSQSAYSLTATEILSITQSSDLDATYFGSVKTGDLHLTSSSGNVRYNDMLRDSLHGENGVFLSSTTGTVFTSSLDKEAVSIEAASGLVHIGNASRGVLRGSKLMYISIAQDIELMGAEKFSFAGNNELGQTMNWNVLFKNVDGSPVANVHLESLEGSVINHGLNLYTSESLSLVAYENVKNLGGNLTSGNILLKAHTGNVVHETLKGRTYNVYTKRSCRGGKMRRCKKKQTTSEDFYTDSILAEASITASGNVRMEAGGDIINLGGSIKAGTAVFLADRDIIFQALALEEKDVRKASRQYWKTTHSMTGLTLDKGHSFMQSGRNMVFHGTSATTQGSLELNVGGKLDILHVLDSEYKHTKKKKTKGNIFAKKRVTRIKGYDRGIVRSSSFDLGGDLTIHVAGDMLVSASQLRTDGNLNIGGIRVKRDVDGKAILSEDGTTFQTEDGKGVKNLAILSADGYDESWHEKHVKKSILGIRTKKIKKKDRILETTQTASELRSEAKAIIKAREGVLLLGSDLHAGEGLFLQAKSFTALSGEEVRETLHSRYEKKLQWNKKSVGAFFRDLAVASIIGASVAFTGGASAAGVATAAGTASGVSGGLGMVAMFANHKETFDSKYTRETTHRASNVYSGGDMSINIAGDMLVVGANFSSVGKTAVAVGGNLGIMHATDTYYTKKSKDKRLGLGLAGLFGLKNIEGKEGDSYHETVRSSNFSSGGDLNFIVGEKMFVIGSNLSAGANVALPTEKQDDENYSDNTDNTTVSNLKIRAKELNIFAAEEYSKETDTEYSQQVKSLPNFQQGLKNLLTAKGEGLELGRYKKRKKKTTTEKLQYQGSLLTANGNVVFVTENDINVLASDIAAGADLIMPAGGNIQAKHLQGYEKKSTHEQNLLARLRLNITQPFSAIMNVFKSTKTLLGNSGNNNAGKKRVEDTAKSLGYPSDGDPHSRQARYGNKYERLNDFNKVLNNVGQAFNTLSLGMEASNLATTAVGGFGLGYSLDVTDNHSSSQSHQEVVYGSSLSANGNLILSSDKEISIVASDVESTFGNVYLAGAEGIEILAAKKSFNSSSTSNYRKVGLGMGSSVSANAGGGNHNFSSKGHTWDHSTISAAKGNLTFVSPKNVSLKGVLAVGKNVTTNIGGELKVETVLDEQVTSLTSDSGHASTSVSSNGTINGAGFGFSTAKGNGTKRWASMQTKLVGTESVHVQANNVHLVGAAIANAREDGSDGGNLIIDAKSITYRDLDMVDISDYTSHGSDANLSFTTSDLPVQGVVNLQFGGASHDKRGVMKATLGHGVILGGASAGDVNRGITETVEITKYDVERAGHLSLQLSADDVRKAISIAETVMDGGQRVVRKMDGLMDDIKNAIDTNDIEGVSSSVLELAKDILLDSPVARLLGENKQHIIKAINTVETFGEAVTAFKDGGQRVFRKMDDFKDAIDTNDIEGVASSVLELAKDILSHPAAELLLGENKQHIIKAINIGETFRETVTTIMDGGQSVFSGIDDFKDGINTNDMEGIASSLLGLGKDFLLDSAAALVGDRNRQFLTKAFNTGKTLGEAVTAFKDGGQRVVGDIGSFNGGINTIDMKGVASSVLGLGEDFLLDSTAALVGDRNRQFLTKAFNTGKAFMDYGQGVVDFDDAINAIDIGSFKGAINTIDMKGVAALAVGLGKGIPSYSTTSRFGGVDTHHFTRPISAMEAVRDYGQSVFSKIDGFKDAINTIDMDRRHLTKPISAMETIRDYGQGVFSKIDGFKDAINTIDMKGVARSGLGLGKGIPSPSIMARFGGMDTQPFAKAFNSVETLGETVTAIMDGVQGVVRKMDDFKGAINAIDMKGVARSGLGLGKGIPSPSIMARFGGMDTQPFAKAFNSVETLGETVTTFMDGVQGVVSKIDGLKDAINAIDMKGVARSGLGLGKGIPSPSIIARFGGMDTQPFAKAFNSVETLGETVRGYGQGVFSKIDSPKAFRRKKEGLTVKEYLAK